jgi:hypothetical protein
MFRTAASVILHRDLKDGDLQMASDDTDKRPLGEIVQRLILRRLDKIERRRALLRRLACCFGFTLSSRSVVAPQSDGDLGESMHSPLERLDDRQALVIGKLSMTPSNEPIISIILAKEGAYACSMLVRRSHQAGHTDDARYRHCWYKPSTPKSTSPVPWC